MAAAAGEAASEVSVLSLSELVSAARAGVELFGASGDPDDVLSSAQLDSLQRVAEVWPGEDCLPPAVSGHEDRHCDDVSLYVDAAETGSAAQILRSREYSFDAQLAAVVRVRAVSVRAARDLVAGLQEVDLLARVGGGVITEASVTHVALIPFEVSSDIDGQ